MDQSRPYLYLFILGLISAFLGLSVWIQFAVFGMNYPSQIHANLMTYGFLLAFGTGFILTFLPKTTRTFPVKKWELMVIVVFATLSTLHDFLGLVSVLLLLNFIITRIRSSNASSLPPFLGPLVLGVISAVLGISIRILQIEFSLEIPFNSKVFLHEGMITLWLIGVGSFMLPMVCQSDWQTPAWAKKILPAVSLLYFVALFFDNFETLSVLARWIRTLILIFASIFYWHFLQLPKNRGYLAWGIWISIGMTLAGFCLRLIVPGFGIHAMHLTYIGGYFLFSLLVGTRVSIAHGAGNFQIETKFRRMAVIIGLVILAAATRFSVHFMPNQFVSHLAYASGTAMIILLIWLSLMFPIWRKHLF